MKQILIEYAPEQPLSRQVQRLKEALEEEIDQTLLIHVYSGLADRGLLNGLLKELGELFPGASIVGTHSAGEISQGRLRPQGVTISGMLFGSTCIKVYRFDGIRGHEEQVGENLRRQLQDMEHLKAVELLFLGTEVNTPAFYDQLKSSPKNIQFFGGYAGGPNPARQEHFIMDETGILEDSLLAITYAGEDFHISVDKTAGWQTIGMPFKITKADGNRLIEINHAPAVEVYEKYLQIDRHDQLAEETYEFPLMVKLNGEEVLRHTIMVEPDGTLLLAGFVTEGMDIYLSYGNPSEIVKKVNKRLEYVSQFQPQAMLLYSCLVRRYFWEDFVDMEMIPFQALCPTAGFFTLGEVRRDPATKKLIEYNITLLSIAMREGEKKNEDLQIARVDDSVLKSQASLVKRLAKLVYSTTSELQKAYENLRSLNSQLLSMAETDALTGLYNRGKIEQLINQALDQMELTGQPVSLIMIDVDHFKRVNDTYGHEIGDQVLCSLSSLMQRATVDCQGAGVGRWGGEEFFILLKETKEQEAFAFAEGLRQSVASHDFPEIHSMTISMGVITLQGQENRREVFTRVDNALYHSKQNGRNQVTVAG